MSHSPSAEWAMPVTIALKAAAAMKPGMCAPFHSRAKAASKATLLGVRSMRRIIAQASGAP
jgi:hypothetical protein